MNIKGLNLWLPLTLLMVIGVPFHTPSLYAQTTSDSTLVIDYSNPKDYEIGSVKVEGNRFSDDRAIIGISGLKVGKKIKVPGPDITSALKALWKIKLFTDISIEAASVQADIIHLLIKVKEQPRLSGYAFKGAKKVHHDDLKDAVKPFLIKGGIVSDNSLQNAKNAIRDYYIEKGYLDASVTSNAVGDTLRPNAVKLVFDIHRNKRVKIREIHFEGNSAFSDRKLRKKMKNTHTTAKVFAKSKFIKDDYEEDKKKILEFYNKNGYRDARITGEGIWRDGEGRMHINLVLQEGPRYFFRNIAWKGNTLYDSAYLTRILGIEEGDVFDSELLKSRLSFSLDGRDVSSLYMDDGYLAFRADPVEVAVDKDSIDVEVRITEGPQFTIGAVRIAGNDRTHEHVIRRELRTRPGHKFSRSDIIRSQREIINLGYFNPENLGINTPINPSQGTVDIEYNVEERSSDQLELSAGYGFGGLFLTFGLVFNNFSTRNITQKSAWNPLPQGDGQKVQVRVQTNGSYYQTVNLSFIEPWLGGKKPRQFTTSGYYTKFGGGFTSGFFQIINGTIGLGSRLSWPDDYFFTNTTLNIQNLKLNNYPNTSFYFNNKRVDEGSFNNFFIKQTFSRISTSDPLFPRSGSNISLSIQLTPPYSLFKKDYNPSDLTVQDRFRFLEYHKWRFNADWYFSIIDKLVVRSAIKTGFLGYYNKKVGTPPFERFRLGGSAFNQQTTGVGLLGIDLITLRGYEKPEEVIAKTATEFAEVPQGDASIFTKMTLELRYLFTSSPSATIYGLAFVEGGNVWNSFKEYNPFSLKRSAGVGFRAQLPMIGLIGVDYGFGFDKPWLDNSASSFKSYGALNVVFGFEPE